MTDKEMINFRMTEYDLLYSNLETAKATEPREVYLGIARYLNKYRDHLVRTSGISDFPKIHGLDEDTP